MASPGPEAWRVELAVAAGRRFGAERAAALAAELAALAVDLARVDGAPLDEAIEPGFHLPDEPPRSAPPDRTPAPGWPDRPEGSRVRPTPAALPGAPLHALTVVEAAGAVRAGRVSSVALVEACLARIDAVDGRLQAWVAVDRTGALEQAARLDADARRGTWRGPLHGVPLGLKDIFHAVGLPTTAGARGFADSRPTEDAESVARLRAAGAVILGKLHTTEFASGDPAVTRNPWHPDRTPGGSSAGSAAAVAARMVPAALGSQTVGSVLRPAAFCGVVGLKPTYGRISRRGVIPLAWTLDHVGILARSVADVALVFSVLAGHDAADPGSAAVAGPDLGPLLAGRGREAPRLGLVEDTLLVDRAAPVLRARLRAVAGELEERGAAVEPVRLPALVPALVSAVQVILRSEAAAYHADRYRRHHAAYRPRIRAAIEAGLCIPAPAYLRAQQVRREARRALGPLLERFDALVMPAAAGPAPDPGTTGDPSFNAPWSGLGVPAIALPVGLDPDGLPLGVQLVATAFDEAGLLETARWVEAAVGWRGAPPDPPPR